MEELSSVPGIRVDHVIESAALGGTSSIMRYCIWGLHYPHTVEGGVDTSGGLKRGAALLYAWQLTSHGKYEICNAAGQMVLAVEPSGAFEKGKPKPEFGVLDSFGRCIGRVKLSRASLTSTKIKMMSGTHKQPAMWIKGPKFPRFSADFKVKRRKPKMDAGVKLRRNWDGWASDPAMALDKYDVTFAPMATGADSGLPRALLLCAVLLLDHVWGEKIAEYVRKYGTGSRPSSSSTMARWCDAESIGWLSLLIVLPLVVLTFPFGLVLLLVPLPFFAAKVYQDRTATKRARERSRSS